MKSADSHSHLSTNRPLASKQPPTRLRVRVDAETAREVQSISDYHNVEAVEVIRAAFRVYVWACRQVRTGRDVGSYDQASGHYVAVDIPFAVPDPHASSESE